MPYRAHFQKQKLFMANVHLCTMGLNAGWVHVPLWQTVPSYLGFMTDDWCLNILLRFRRVLRNTFRHGIHGTISLYWPGEFGRCSVFCTLNERSGQKQWAIWMLNKGIKYILFWTSKLMKYPSKFSCTAPVIPQVLMRFYHRRQNYTAKCFGPLWQHVAFDNVPMLPFNKLHINFQLIFPQGNRLPSGANFRFPLFVCFHFVPFPFTSPLCQWFS